MLRNIFILGMFLSLVLGGKLMAPVNDKFSLSSSAFTENGTIPAVYTCDSENKNGISPPLEWKNAPEETVSFVLIMDDPDAPVGNWDHWLVFNIPATITHLDANLKKLPAGVQLGANSWNRFDYGGPCPPDREHRYFFKIYALDIELSLEEGASKQEIEAAMEGHILAQAQLMARYDRPNR